MQVVVDMSPHPRPPRHKSYSAGTKKHSIAPSICNICGKTFTDPGNKSRHIKNAHPQVSLRPALPDDPDERQELVRRRWQRNSATYRERRPAEVCRSHLYGRYNRSLDISFSFHFISFHLASITHGRCSTKYATGLPLCTGLSVAPPLRPWARRSRCTCSRCWI